MHASKTVGQLLGSKGREVFTIAPDTSVFAALEMMAARNVGALVVTERGSVVGIFSERDYARKVILKDRASRGTLVNEIMTPDVVTVSTSSTLDDCMSLMTDRRIRHLPVVEDGRLIGIVSVGDVVKSVMAEQQFLIDQLQEYIGQ